MSTSSAASKEGGGGGTSHDPIQILKAFGHSFLDGTLLAIKAIKLCLNNPDVIAVHKQIFLPVAGFTIALYIGIFFATLPLKFLFWLLRFDTARLAGWSSAITSMTPLAVNFALRFIFYSPLDRAYLSILKDLDPQLAKKLQTMQVRSWKEMLFLEVKRMIGIASFLPIYAVLSIIPGIGRFLKFGFEIYTLSKWFQPGVAVSLAVVSTFPLTEYIVTLGIQAFFSQMALAQEIQLPYLGRIRVSRREEIKMISRQPIRSLGFIVPFNLLLLVPYIGPLFCILAHAAAPIALKDLMMVDTTEAQEQINIQPSAPPLETTTTGPVQALVGDAPVDSMSSSSKKSM